MTAETERDAGIVDPPPLRPEAREWMPWREPETRPPIRYRTTTRSRDGECEITLSKLTRSELEAVEAFLIGQRYLGCFKGRLYSYDVHGRLPGPLDDPLMSQHWDSEPEEKQYGGPPEGKGIYSPGIVITAVGAGGGRGEPKRSYEILTECGFVCLRSPKGPGGKHWEQWVLHSLACANGPLKEHLAGREKDWKKNAEDAASYLATTQRVAFGTLDITIQW